MSHSSSDHPVEQVARQGDTHHHAAATADQAADHDDAGGGSSLAAVWVPMVALGLLGVAVWFGSMPSTQPPVPVAGPTAAVPNAAEPADPLPSWNDGATKERILSFVADVTRPGATTFVPPEERVAVFDHDGTLVCEKPIVHGAFLIARVKAFLATRPDLAHEEPYATLLGGDLDFVHRLGKKFFADLTFSTLAGVPEDRLEDDVRDFLATARHPTFDVPFADVTFQPMKELIALLQAKGFSVWICSGSGVHFMRPAAAAWYGIGPEHVIASRSTSRIEEVEPAEPLPPAASPNRRLALVIQPDLEVLNDEARKPVSIGEHIGRRPIFAAGNVGTGGDVEMLRWSQSGSRPNLQLLVLHDDADREMAYGEPTNQSLDAAATYGWQVVRMATDWKRVFAQPLTKRPAPAAGAAPAAVPSGTVPAGRAEPAAGAAVPPPVRWAEELATYAAADRDTPPQPGGICLLGSSNIRLWTTLAQDFPGLNLLNRGVGGCRLDELAGFGKRLVAASRPSVVVVSAGGNDIAAGRTAEDVRTAFAALVADLRAAHPRVPVVFLSINPSIRRWDQFARQQEANAAVKSFIEGGLGGDGLHFIDVTSAFLDADGKPAAECFIDDQLHPSTIGNARRAALMRPLLESLVPPAASVPPVERPST